jgi:hypothetical protein
MFYLFEWKGDISWFYSKLEYCFSWKSQLKSNVKTCFTLHFLKAFWLTFDILWVKFIFRIFYNSVLRSKTFYTHKIR